ncbi:10338_t:CDS:1 [Paraglomus occultum]|uniref:10338_t:CDS:1 n=1 Tax=Paraglomus occultum TaxID=144539 RepID=A0A9N9ABA4_9GLOM|nr:10338_t:CDS:1 [Paraglomus occultum]
MAPIDSSSITREAIALLFNAAKVLAEQQTKMKIESVHFMDGRVHLNMRDTSTIDVAVNNSQEPQNLGQRVDAGDKMNYHYKSVDLNSERDMGENNNHSGMGMACDPVLTYMAGDSLMDMLIEQQKSHDQMNTVDQIQTVDQVSSPEIRNPCNGRENGVRPSSPIISSLPSPSSSSSHSPCPRAPRSAGTFEYEIVESPSVRSTQSSTNNDTITSLARNVSASVTRTATRRQPVRNALSVYASHSPLLYNTPSDISVFEIPDDDSSDESSYHKSNTKKSPVKNAKYNDLAKKGLRTLTISKKGRPSTKALHDSNERPTPASAKGSKNNTATKKRLPQSRGDALDESSSPRQSKKLKPSAEPSIQASVRKTNQKTLSRKSTIDTSEESEREELPSVPSKRSARITSPNSPKHDDMSITFIQPGQINGQLIPISIQELADDSGMTPRKPTKKKQDACIKKSSPKANVKQTDRKVPHIARQSSPRIYIPSSIGSKLDPKSGSYPCPLSPPSNNDLDRYAEMGHRLKVILGDMRVADCINKLPACPTSIPDTLKMHYFRLFNVYKKLGNTREETFIHVDNLKTARLRIKQWERMDYRLVGSETEVLHLQSALLFADIFNDTEVLFRGMYDETSAATRKRTMKLFSDSMTEWNASNVPILRKTAIRIMFLVRLIEFDELVQAGITVKILRCYRPQYKKLLEECFGPEVAEKLVDKEHEMTMRANEVGEYGVYRKKYKKKRDETKVDSRELNSLLD